MKECQHCKTCYADEIEACPVDGMPTVHTIAGEPVLEGKYHLDSRIGQGGMGVVYRARHAYLKTLHAIKIILPDLVGNDPQLVTRFRQEALAAAAIRHQNVVGVSDYGVINGNVPFLVMEYVEGGSLHDLLDREKRLDPEKTLELMSAVCAGVGAAHHQGIVHRDLKPLNIMICTDRPNISQAVKILDFGLAKIKSGELLGSFIQAQTTGLMGSPYYMAPEQWSDDEPEATADVYSLGVMCFQMLTGEVPFKGSSIPAIMKKHLSDPPPTFFDLGIQLPAALERAVIHALAKSPKDRTPSVEQFIAELSHAIRPERAVASLPVSTLSITTRPPNSSVFVDSISMGSSRGDGSLLLEGIQSGNHHLRVAHEGFDDWASEIICDGKPQQIVAELRSRNTPSLEAIPRPFDSSMPSKTVGIDPLDMTESPTIIRGAGAATMVDANASRAFDRPQQTMAPAASTQFIGVADEQPRKSRTAFWGIIAGLSVLGIVILGIGGAYLAGLFSGPSAAGNSTGKAATPVQQGSPAVSPSAEPVKPAAEMALIPGGSFEMGSDSGPDNEKPAHTVTVSDLRMDKTEVTNREYAEFAAATERKELPSDWVNGKPLAGQEDLPVRFVNIADVEAFAAWRSKRDGVNYRLPTEAEWEYAARNGDAENKYPWGNSFDAKCAVVERGSNTPEPVGRTGCADKWGVTDLIGNVFEWTSTEAALYPGSKGAIAKAASKRNMVRGGAAFSKSSGPAAATSTFRVDVDVSKRSQELGFRLVRDL